MRRGLLVLGAVLWALLGACSTSAAPPLPAPVYDSAFWRAWGDGQAELDGYKLTRSRYGEGRAGTAVAIFVTEPWSPSLHVKVDDPAKHPGDVVQALKLNLVESFQTGIYDYHLMTSAWVALEAAPGRPAGGPAKVAFTAQEWCGTTFSELVVDDKGAHETVKSYFEGESGARSLAKPAPNALVEDLLLVWARGLAAPVLKPGESAVVPFLPAQSRARLLHTPGAWTEARVTRSPQFVNVDVPAGRFPTERVVVEVTPGAQGARTIELFVEVAAPRRVVKVTTSEGTTLELTGTVRTPYWQKNHEGDEKMLDALGLKPVAR